MAGTKHNLDGDPVARIEESRSSPFLPIFTQFRDELDEHHDRRERMVKASRDVTASSKKMWVKASCSTPQFTDNSEEYSLFTVARVQLIPAPLPTSITKDISKHDTIIRSNLENISKDLAPPNDHRYSRQVSPGLQEMVEALTFSYYLQHQRLATPAELQALLSEGVKLSNDDYLLGLCDLVGEMMRIAITCIATRGRLPGGASTESEDAREPHHVPRTILEDLREIRVFFEKLNVDGELGRDIGKKMDVLRTCVEKVETAAYGMIVRGRERPKGWVPDLSEDHKSTEGVEIF